MSDIYQTKPQTDIYPQSVRPLVTPTVASHRAYMESVITKTPATLEAREEEQQKGNVLDGAVKLIAELIETDKIVDEGQLIGWNELPEDERVARAVYLLQQSDMNVASARHTAFIAALQGGAYDVPIEKFEEYVNTTDTGTLMRMKSNYQMEQQKRVQEQYQSILDSATPETKFEGMGDFIAGELIPFFSVGARLGLSKSLLDAVGSEKNLGARGWFTGEVRKEIRDHLVSLPPEQRMAAIRDLVEVVNELEGDAVYGPVLTDYNIRETFENLLTPDLIQKSVPENSIDRFIGNLEIALGGLVTGYLAAKVGGKTLKQSLFPLRGLPEVEMARQTENKTFISEFAQALLNSEVAKKFGVKAEEVAVQFLPKADSLADDIKVLAPETKAIYERGTRIKNEIMQATSRLTGYALAPQDKVKVVEDVLRKLDNADQMTPIPSMSTLKMLEGDVGFKISATVGKNANEGFSSPLEVAKHVAELDPELRNVTVWRRGESGDLERVFQNPGDLKNVLEGGVPLADDEYIYAGLRVSELTDEDLLRISTTESDQEILDAIEREARRRAGTNPVKDEYFIKFEQERFWHPVDKEFLSPDSFRNTGRFPRMLLDWKAKLGDAVYGVFDRLYKTDQFVSANLEEIFLPFYRMNTVDKRAVSSMFEWSEQYGKEFAKNPSLVELKAAYPEMTTKQLEGYIALRQGHDTMFELLNRRMYREYVTMGYRTARPTSVGLPTFHGKPLDRTDAYRKFAYDVENRKLVQLSKADVDGIYDNGGAILKNDLAIDIGEGGGKADLILVDGKSYQLGELSEMPLKYHPGYSIRFYNDPYFIVKRTKNASVNGVVTGEVFEQAIRTAPTRLSAENFLSKGNNTPRGPDLNWSNGTDPNIEYKIVRARDIDQAETTFLQKQAIHQEGRIFWDERNFDRLLDVSGNSAMLDDPVQSLERATGMLARQVSMEDTMKSLKQAFINEFGNLVPAVDIKTQEMGIVVKALRRERNNSANAAQMAKYNRAIEMANYLRLIEGTNDPLIPLVRRGIMQAATMVERLTRSTKVGRVLEKWAEVSDPMRTIRSVAFNLFMVLRPARQWLLQSSQVTLISALDPIYVGSGQLFRDSHALRSMVSRLRRDGYDDGFSMAKLSKSMGITQKEARKLAKEFNRSGVLDVVDLHSFAGGSRKYQKQAITGNLAIQRAVSPIKKVRDFSQDIGFNAGERNNMTFSYLMALRQIVKKYKHKSLLNLTDKQWDEITQKASDLSFGMTRMNQFGYQAGLLSAGTQFMSFTHKAALTLLAQNPAIKGKDALKVLVGSYTLFGANMFGARDFVQEALRSMGLQDWGNEMVPGAGSTVVDILAGGVIEKIFNELGSATVDSWQDLNLGAFAPGVDIRRLREFGLEAITKSWLTTLAGPSGSIGTKFLDAHNWVATYINGPSEFDTPAERFRVIIDAYASGLVPQYSDVTKARIARRMGYWTNQMGDPMPIRAELSGVLARGLFGIRTLEESLYYEFQRNAWDDEDERRSIVKANKDFFKKLWNDRTNNGETLTTEDYARSLYVMSAWMDDWPEGERLEILEQSLTEKLPDEPQSIIEIMADDPLMYDKTNSVFLERMIELDPRLSDQQAKEFKLFLDEIYKSRQNAESYIQNKITREKDAR